MNRRIRPFFLAATCCLLHCGARANDIDPGKEFYSAIRAPSPIVLDGDLSEWKGVPVLADPKFYVKKGAMGTTAGKGTGGVGADLVLFEEYGGGTWTGPDDQTSAVQVVYDDDNVYLGFVVTDDYHENSANSAWNGDSVQLMLADGNRTVEKALVNFALGGVEEALGEVIVQQERGTVVDAACNCPAEAVVKRNTETKRTTYEIKVPKAALGLTTLSGGVKFGLGMAINDGDKDTPGQKGWGGLGAHAIVFGKTPSETALITLAKKNDIEPGKEIYTANPAPKPIVLDGNLSEWSGVPVLADPKFYVKKGAMGTTAGKGTAGVGADLVLFEEYGGGTWTGPDDQTSAVQIVYDTNNVYFGFVVTDDYHENSANSAWNGDSVQLMIANGAQNQEIALVNYALGGVEEALGEVIVNHERGTVVDPACDCQTEAVVTRNTATKRTTYEIKLPKAALGLTNLVYGTQFGLGMAINDGDKDTPGQKGWGGLGAHAIVFGKTPGETALVTLGVGGVSADLLFLSAINPGIEAFTFRANDKGTSILDASSATLIIDGQKVTLTASPKKLDATDFTHKPASLFAPGVTHTYSIEVKDTQGHVVADSGTFTTPNYAMLTAAQKVTPDTAKRGFIWRVHQNSAFQTVDSIRPQMQLAGLLGVNNADRNAQGIAIALGTAGANNRLPIQFEIDSTINMSQEGTDNAGYFTTDDVMPGIPGIGAGDTAPTDGIAGEISTYLELPAGKVTLAVRSDDGFVAIAGNVADVFTSQVAADSGGAVADMAFSVYVNEAGVYPFRFIWGEGGGGANIELLSVNADNTRVLLNDTANGGIKAYRALSAKGPAGISLVSPARSATGVALDASVIAVIRDGASAVDTASVKLTVDGSAVAASAAKAGDQTTIEYKPSAFWASGSSHTATVTFTAGGTSRTESWQFTVGIYATLTRSQQATSVDTSKPGFVWKVFQNEAYTHTSLAQTELALAGQLKDAAGTPVTQNLADPNSYGPALDIGTKVGALLKFDIPTVINFSQAAGEANGYFSPDDQMPGIPGTTSSTDGIDGEVVTFVELPAGAITMGVVSDDSFRVQAGYINTPADAVTLGEVDNATANVTFRFVVQDAGVYPLRTIWVEGGGGAHLELFTVKADGTRVLLNDTANGGYKAYRTGSSPNKPTEPPKFSTIKAAQGSITIEWTGGGTLQSATSVAGPWQAVSGASSPYKVNATQGMLFYRLRQ